MVAPPTVSSSICFVAEYYYLVDGVCQKNHKQLRYIQQDEHKYQQEFHNASFYRLAAQIAVMLDIAFALDVHQ